MAALIENTVIMAQVSSLKPTVRAKDKKDKQATLKAFPTLKLAISSPIKAQTNGTQIIPKGGKKKPIKRPIVEPHTAHLDPPPSLVAKAGAK